MKKKAACRRSVAVLALLSVCAAGLAAEPSAKLKALRSEQADDKAKVSVAYQFGTLDNSEEYTTPAAQATKHRGQEAHGHFRRHL